jgi:hypothetical protein
MPNYFLQNADGTVNATPNTTEVALAATLLNVPNFIAASSANQDAACAQASDEIDRGLRLQGRKYLFTQANEFPRTAFESSRRTTLGVGPIGAIGPAGVGSGDEIWDWDATNNVAIIPKIVYEAVIIQADSIIANLRAGRQDSIHDGIRQQGSAGESESYDREAPGAKTPLCRRAYQLLWRYKIKQGRQL